MKLNRMFKKRMRLVITLCFAMVFATTGCGRNTDQSENNISLEKIDAEKTTDTAAGEQQIDFLVQYIRTNGYSDGEQYPKALWITTAEELDGYYENNKDKYDLDLPYDESVGFADAVKGYDEVFFEQHDLLFVILEEGSGSIRHEVTTLKAVQAQNGKCIIRPEITRIIPESGTDDMAEWHIVIEVGKAYGRTVSEEIEPVITEEHAATSSGTAEPSGADTASVVGPFGQISVYIPATWTAEAVPVDSDKMMFGLYGLVLKPKDAADGHIELFCSDSFGVCGTGLLQEEQTLAGQSVHIGTYDSHAHWDFITFGMGNPQVVAQHTDCDSWTDAMWEEALSVLDTMQFNDRIKEGGVGQFIRESENDEIAVIMEVDHVTASGLTVRFQQYDKRDAGELLYGEGYSLQVLNGDAWEDVPTIIGNGAFHDEGYVIPPEGKAGMEINWEWLYGRLTPGTYRITKSVWGGGKPDGTMTPAYPLTAQFIIAG